MIAWGKIRYFLEGFIRRYNQKRVCPSCNTRVYQSVDFKGFHELLSCDYCKLLYRWPYETKKEMTQFYQSSYKQNGLTTTLPDNSTLAHLLSTNFVNSEKDFSRFIKLFKTLLVRENAKILDFGANWGYGVWQLQKAGFSTIGYELSEPRASYSKNLGVEVFTDWKAIKNRGPFDVVYSSHVLEHTPDPAKCLNQKLEVLSTNGFLVALFPNGSINFQMANKAAFHKLWGRVHPFLLDENFILKVLSEMTLSIGNFSTEDLVRLNHWDRKTTLFGTLDSKEMLVVGTR